MFEHVHIVKDLEKIAGLVRRNLSNKSKSAGDERSDPETFVPPTDFIPPKSFIPRLVSHHKNSHGTENVRCRNDVLAAYVREKEKKKEKKDRGRVATKTTEVSLSG